MTNDNFGPEDTILRGLKEDFDLSETQASRGFHDLEPIKLLVSGLIAANQKNLNDDDISTVADQVVRLIVGKDGRGNRAKDDEWLIHLIAKRVYEQLYGYELEHGFEQESPKSVKLRPIVTSVLKELEHSGKFRYGQSVESDIVRIETKFKNKQDYYLARAGIPAVNEEYLERFKLVCVGLKHLGIKTDFSSLKNLDEYNKK